MARQEYDSQLGVEKIWAELAELDGTIIGVECPGSQMESP